MKIQKTVYACVAFMKHCCKLPSFYVYKHCSLSYQSSYPIHVELREKIEIIKIIITAIILRRGC